MTTAIIIILMIDVLRCSSPSLDLSPPLSVCLSLFSCCYLNHYTVKHRELNKQEKTNDEMHIKILQRQSETITEQTILLKQMFIW